MSGPQPMDLARLRALLDAYGGDPERWPESERAAALALLGTSAAARAERAAAAELDAALDADPAVEPSPALAVRILAGAPMAKATLAPRSATVLRPMPRTWRRNPLRYLAAAAPLAAAAAGLALWLAGTPQPEAPLADDVIADLGTYGTPGDALLTVTEVDVLDDDPWTDCSAGGLGCLDLDALELDPLSGDISGRNVS